MTENLEEGDVAQTIHDFFEQSKYIKPCKKSVLSIQQVDKYLAELSKYSKSEDQVVVLTKIARRYCFIIYRKKSVRIW